MKAEDYTIPPTEEFAHKTESEFHGGVWGWLTLQKAVMNDYYFDHDGFHEDGITIDRNGGLEYDDEYFDAFMHKIYYCWQEAMRILHEQISGGLEE